LVKICLRKIDELLGICEEIKTRTKQSQTNPSHLTDAIVE